MPRYLVTRTLPPLTSEQLNVVGKKVVDACSQISGMQWVRSHLTADQDEIGPKLFTGAR